MIRTSATLALVCASFSTAQSLSINISGEGPVSYTHLRAHET